LRSWSESIDLSTIGDYGSESDPRAYRFDGELNVPTGLDGIIEMLKADERFSLRAAHAGPRKKY